MEHTQSISAVGRGAGPFGRRCSLREQLYRIFNISLSSMVLFGALALIGAMLPIASPLVAAQEADEEMLAEPDAYGPIEGALLDDGRAEEAQSFSHKLILPAYAGLPAQLIFSTTVNPPKTVRALLTLDGRLLVVPLRPVSGTGSFRAEFPGPRGELTYQFQIISESGVSLLSDVFFSSPRCEEEAFAESLNKKEKFPGQAAMLEEALKLDRDIQRHKYLLDSIEYVLSKGK